MQTFGQSLLYKYTPYLRLHSGDESAKEGHVRSCKWLEFFGQISKLTRSVKKKISYNWIKHPKQQIIA